MDKQRMTVLYRRWCHLLKEGGATCEPKAPFEALLRAYGEPHRRFHVIDHIADCLDEFWPVRHMAEIPVAVGLGLFFHDKRYVIGRDDNELKSGYDLFEFCINNGMTDFAAPGYDDVVATDHKQPRYHHTPDQTLTVDIDLSSLGKPPADFDRGSAFVQKEYEIIPDDQFYRGALEIFRTLASHDPLYRTEHFRRKYEQQAQENIKRYISFLEAATK